MNITVIGTGYVGLVTGACLSNFGNHVTCVDIDHNKIKMLNDCKVPFFEIDLEEIIKENLNQTLFFSTCLESSIKDASIIIIAVGTPSLPNGSANLEYVLSVSKEIAKSINGYKIVMIKSTVPIGTNEKITKLIGEQTTYSFDVVSVPEFLKEGSAVRDTLKPDRIIIGTSSERAIGVLKELHSPFNSKIIVTNEKNAEMIKYASNAFLATKISFINEISNICEKVGADITEVARGMGYDSRITPHFLNAGIGYGGSCFPKDIKALISLAKSYNYNPKLLQNVEEVNNDQIERFMQKIKNILGDVKNNTIAIWGAAFKPKTDDIREAPSVKIIEKLLELGANVHVYDPLANNNLKKVFTSKKVFYFSDAINAATDSDAVCVLTEWDEFRNIDLKILGRVMKRPILIDGRNLYSLEQVVLNNFHYYSMGRSNVEPINTNVLLTGQ